MNHAIAIVYSVLSVHLDQNSLCRCELVSFFMKNAWLLPMLKKNSLSEILVLLMPRC